MKRKLLLWIVVWLLLASAVSALGILPAKQSVSSELLPVKYTGSFKIVNNQHGFLDLVVYPQGPLEEYITIEQQRVTMTPDQEFIEVYFTLGLDARAPRGLVETKLVVEELIGDSDSLSNSLGSRLRLFHKLLVRTPYEGKYIGASVSLHEDEQEYEIVTTVNNLGSENIAELQAAHRVLDNSRSLLTLRTISKELVRSKEEALTTTFKKNVLKNGQYDLLSTVTYDDDTLEMSNIVVIGEPELTIVSYDQSLTAGEINLFSFNVKSDWNAYLEEMFADIIIEQNGAPVASTSTKPIFLPPNQLTTFESFIDAKDLEPGEYTVSITIHYLGFEHTASYSLRIQTLEQLEKEQRKDTLLAYLMITLIALLVVTLILVTLQFMRSSHPQR